MKNEKLYLAMQDLDGDLLLRSETAASAGKRLIWRYAAVLPAAAVLLVFAIGAVLHKSPTPPVEQVSQSESIMIGNEMPGTPQASSPIQYPYDGAWGLPAFGGVSGSAATLPEETPPEETANTGETNDSHYGAEEPDDGDYEILVWVPQDLVALTEEQIVRFNAENKDGLTFHATVTANNDTASTLISEYTATYAPRGADLFLIGDNDLPKLVTLGAVSAPDEAASAEITASVAPTAAAAATVGGTVYAYPLTLDCAVCMFYDKSVIPAEHLGSLERMLADCEAAGRTFCMPMDSPMDTIAPFFLGTGCNSVWQPDAIRYFDSFASVNDTFNSPAGKKAVQGWKTLTASPAVRLTRNLTEYLDESAVAVFNRSALSYLAEAYGENLGAAPLPSFTADGAEYPLTVLSYSSLYGVRPQNSAVKTEALHKLAQFLTSEEAQREIVRRTAEESPYPGSEWGPANLAAQQAPIIQSDPGWAATLEQCNRASVLYGRKPRDWNNALRVLGVELQASANDTEIQAALDNYSAAVDALFHGTYLPEYCVDYEDVDRSAWYHAAVDFVLRNDYMKSTRVEAFTFEPEAKVTRAMVASIVYRIAHKSGERVEFQGVFSDVTDQPRFQWYTREVDWCGQNGLVSGRGDGTFDPDGLVTRQELAVVLYNLAVYLNREEGTEIAPPDPEADDLSAFPDAAVVPAWAEPYVKWAVEAGLLTGQGQGDGTTLLAPTATAMRCELASILQRFLTP